MLDFKVDGYSLWWLRSWRSPNFMEWSGPFKPESLWWLNTIDILTVDCRSIGTQHARQKLLNPSRTCLWLAICQFLGSRLGSYRYLAAMGWCFISTWDYVSTFWCWCLKLPCPFVSLQDLLMMIRTYYLIFGCFGYWISCLFRDCHGRAFNVAIQPIVSEWDQHPTSPKIFFCWSHLLSLSPEVFFVSHSVTVHVIPFIPMIHDIRVHSSKASCMTVPTPATASDLFGGNHANIWWRLFNYGMVHFRGFSPCKSWGICRIQALFAIFRLRHVMSSKSRIPSLGVQVYSGDLLGLSVPWPELEDARRVNFWIIDTWGAKIVSNWMLTEVGMMLWYVFSSESIFFNQILTCGCTQDSSDFKIRFAIIVFVMWNIATLDSDASNYLQPSLDSTPNIHLMVR